LPSHTHAIAKVNIEKSELKDGIVWGWASIIHKDGAVVRDHQGDQITEAELMKKSSINPLCSRLIWLARQPPPFHAEEV
jgi:hypothetical protein